MPFRIRATKLTCIKQTGDPGSDEPYLVVFTARYVLFPLQAIVNIGPTIDDVDEGETHTMGSGVLVWGIDDNKGTPADIPDPDNLIILCALMESDGSSKRSIRAVLQAALFANLASYLQCGWTRADAVIRLKQDMAALIEVGAMSDGTNQDDPIDRVLELDVSQSFLDGIAPGHGKTTSLEFKDRESNGLYFVDFGFFHIAPPREG